MLLLPSVPLRIISDLQGPISLIGGYATFVIVAGEIRQCMSVINIVPYNRHSHPTLGFGAKHQVW